MTPTLFVVATGSAYVHEFEAESESDAQYWISGLRASAGQAEAVTLHGYAADALLTSLSAPGLIGELGAEGEAGVGQGEADGAAAPAAEWASAGGFDEGPNAIRASIAGTASFTRTRTLTSEL